MKPFLYRVVEQYYQQHGEDLQHFSFVFPNKRAGLFFQKYLIELIEKPIFSPQILSISDCFHHSTDYVLADRTDTLFELFEIYEQLSTRMETFDTFVYWGEQLLTDFDEVDKFLVDAQQLFSNLTSLHELNTYDYLSETQKKAIVDFWGCFATDFATDTAQQDFLYLWELMLPIYTHFRKRLRDKGVATDGMIAREVAEGILSGEELSDFWTKKKFVFVGFNVLNACEKVLFDALQKMGVADFYWDYEAAELTDSNTLTSIYSKENPQKYPSKYPITPETLPMSERSIKLISVPSSIGQTKEVYRLLEGIVPTDTRTMEWEKIAVVLPDEQLLLPMLSAIPDHIDSINITMGYPLSASPIADFMQHIFDLHLKKNSQGKYYHIAVNHILNHRYLHRFLGKKIAQIQQDIIHRNLVYIPSSLFEDNDLLRTIFTPSVDSHRFVDYLLAIMQQLKLLFDTLDETQEMEQFDSDFVYQYQLTLNRLKDVMLRSQANREMEIATMVRIIKQLVDGVSLPFEGEPLNGLQLMGVLETRGLDFDHLLICSFNETVFPKSTIKNSFIPYLLRKAFGLSISEHHDAVHSYNFYRLIGRAKNIYLLYDSRTDGLQSGNVSRFAKQLQYYHKANIAYEFLSYDMKTGENQPIVVDKNESIIKLLQMYLDEGKRSLSASAINTFLDCSLKFYFSYLERMVEPDDISESIEPSTFGSIVHRVLENIYDTQKGCVVSVETLDGLIAQKIMVQQRIVEAFHEIYFKKTSSDTLVELDGYVLLIAKVVEKYVLQVLEKDKAHAPFTYVESEKRVATKIKIANGQKVNLKGFVDRIDRKENTIRIVDYKSGRQQQNFLSLEDVFDRTMGKKRPSFVLQIYLYCWMYELEETHVTEQGYALKPSLYYIRNVFDPAFNLDVFRGAYRQKVMIDDFLPDSQEFQDRLVGVLDEIFDANLPFVQCEDREVCEYCPYSTICGR